MEIVVVLHNVRSVYNVGSVFRTCDAAGVGKVYLVGVTPTPLDRFGNFRADFSKVALGAEKTVEWDGSARSPQAALKLLDKLRGEGYKILAVEQDRRAIPYYQYTNLRSQVSVLKRLALVFVEEARKLKSQIFRK